MTHDRAARRALTSALATRFGEDVPLPEPLGGLETLAAIATHRTGRSYQARAVAPALLRLIAACCRSDFEGADRAQAAIRRSNAGATARAW